MDWQSVWTIQIINSYVVNFFLIHTSFFSATKNHQSLLYIRKKHTYTTGDNKHLQKDVNRSKLD